MSNISFSGRVFLSGSTQDLSQKSEVAKLKQFADNNNCDVVVINRDYYGDNIGVYDSLLLKEDEQTGQNLWQRMSFDFKNDKNISKKIVNDKNYKYVFVSSDDSSVDFIG